MRLPERVPFAKCMVVAALAALAPVAAQAQTTAEPWKWEAAIYGWFPSLGGTTSFPSGASGPTIDVSADKLIDALKFAFMGQIQGRTGKWGVLGDVVYSDMGGSQQSSRDFTVGGQPVGVDAVTGDEFACRLPSRCNSDTSVIVEIQSFCKRSQNSFVIVCNERN